MTKYFLDKIIFNQDGLIPVITQQYDSKEVLMMAWMNEEAILKTLKTKQVHYYSRSRQNLWLKGETSGHTQKLVEFRLDCDQDCILLLIDQKGAACHTNRKNCFYNLVKDGEIIITEKPIKS
mgnify:CR=1 FL=1